MSEIDKATKRLNDAADKATITTNFFDELTTAGNQSDVTNPNNNKTVPSVSKQVIQVYEEAGLNPDAISRQNQQLIRNLGDWQVGLTFENQGDYATYNDQAIVASEETTLPYTTQGADPTASPDAGNVVPFAEVTRSDVVLNVASISELLSVQPTGDGSKVNVTAYHDGWDATNDAPKGGGVFVWDSSRSKSDHNGGTVIDPDAHFPALWGDTGQQEVWFDPGSGGSGCWVRQYDDAVSLKWFGVKGDGIVDETTAIRTAILTKDSIAGGGPYDTYKVSGTLILPPGLENVGFDFKGASFNIESLDGPLFEISQSLSQVVFSNFVVIGDPLNTNSKVIVDNVADANLPTGAYTYQMYVSNIKCINVATFSDLARVRHSKFDRIRGTGGKYGFRFYGKCNENNLVNCTIFADTAPFDIYSTSSSGVTSFCEGIISTSCTYELSGADNTNTDLCSAVRGTQGQHIVFRDCWIGSLSNTKTNAGYQDFYLFYFSRDSQTNPDANIVNAPIIQGCNLSGSRVFINNNAANPGRNNGVNVSGNTLTVYSDYSVDNAIYINGYNSSTVFGDNNITITKGDFDNFLAFYRQESLVFTSNSFKGLGGTVGTLLTFSLSENIVENSNNYNVSYTTERIVSNSSYSEQGKYVLESGSSPNGNYTMYSDGTMVAYGKKISVTLDANSEGDVKYPVAFNSSGIPVVSMGVSGSSEYLAESGFWSESNERFGFKLVSISTGVAVRPGEVIEVSYYAIGRWKV